MFATKLVAKKLATKKHLMRRRCSSALSVAAVTLALAVVPRACAAGLKNISREEFHADALRLQGIVAECAVSAAACNTDNVGDDVLVGDRAKGGFEQHWQWLRATLIEVKTAKTGDRARLTREAEEQLADMAQESSAIPAMPKDFSRARADANAILARPEFQRATGTTWWERKKAQMIAWLERLFDGVARVGMAAPWLGALLEWVFFVGAAVGLLFFLLRNVRRQRLRLSLDDAALQIPAWDSEAEDWAWWAEEHAAAGEWRDAVHCLYWSAIVLLEAKRAWRHNPARTPREYVRLLKTGSAQQQGLRGLTQIFERVWYGLREASGEEYAEARAIYERLAVSGAANAEARTTGAGGTLSAGGAA